MRVGCGFDYHKLVEGRPLILAGVTIPSTKGLLGHSDGDVVSHAIADALLGATGQKDIGYHFPEKNPKFKNISSLVILERIARLLKVKRYRIVNIDSTVICQQPRIASYREKMRHKLSKLFNVEKDVISIKGKTTEGVGLTGEGKGIACYAVCLLEDIPKQKTYAQNPLSLSHRKRID